MTDKRWEVEIMKVTQREEIIKLVLDGSIRQTQAAHRLGLTDRHLRRLLTAYRLHGKSSLWSNKFTRSGGWNRTSTDIEHKIVELVKTKYVDFNNSHLRDMLMEHEGIRLSYPTLRRILQRHGLWTKKYNTGKHFHRREPMPCAGMMLQMDTSIHHWLKLAPEKEFCLIAIEDDATNMLMYARFEEQDTSLGNMRGLYDVIDTRGIFGSLYVDKASHFKTTRKNTLDQEKTQIERAMAELGIEMIHANTPQAKGRIERFFRVPQDRLVNELALNKCTTMAQANEYLKTWINSYNRKFSKPAKENLQLFTAAIGINLKKILSIQDSRIVNSDYCISWNNIKIQLPKETAKFNLANKKVHVCHTIDNLLLIFYKNLKIFSLKLDQDYSDIKEAA